MNQAEPQVGSIESTSATDKGAERQANSVDYFLIVFYAVNARPISLPEIFVDQPMSRVKPQVKNSTS